MKKKSKGLSIKSMILIISILVLSLGYVRIKVEQIKIGYKISENNKVEKKLIQNRQELRAQFMELKSPIRLEEHALNLGFKFPTPDDIIFVDKTTIVGKNK